MPPPWIRTCTNLHLGWFWSFLSALDRLVFNFPSTLKECVNISWQIFGHSQKQRILKGFLSRDSLTWLVLVLLLKFMHFMSLWQPWIYEDAFASSNRHASHEATSPEPISSIMGKIEMAKNIHLQKWKCFDIWYGIFFVIWTYLEV